MTALMMPASLQHIEERNEIGVSVRVWMIDRMAHTGLRREVDYCCKSMLGKQLTHRLTIRDVELHEIKTRMLAQDSQPRPLQGGVVVAVEIVQTDDVTAFRQQLARSVKPDEAGRTRDQDCLIRHRIPWASVRLPS